METFGEKSGEKTPAPVDYKKLMDNIADVDLPQLPELPNGGGGEKTVILDGLLETSPKRANQLKHWFFTWNNYPKNAVETLETKFSELCTYWIFQKEIGATCGTPHIQGAICLKKPGRWSEFGLPKQICWQATRMKNEAIKYCCKEETRDGDQVWCYPHDLIKRATKPLKIIDKLYPWQQYVYDICTQSTPDDRTVNWVYDPQGYGGKTALARYMCVKKKAIYVASGQSRDIFHSIAESTLDLRDTFTVVINVPRSNDTVNYNAIEQIKDGMIFSGKYESKTVLFNPPHVWVFSNDLPHLASLSADRWRLWTITEGILKKYTLFTDEM